MNASIEVTRCWNEEIWNSIDDAFSSPSHRFMGSRILVFGAHYGFSPGATNMDTFLMFNIHFLGVHTVNKCQPHFLSQSKCILQAGADRKLWSSSDDPWDYRVVTWSLSDLWIIHTLDLPPPKMQSSPSGWWNMFTKNIPYNPYQPLFATGILVEGLDPIHIDPTSWQN